MQTGAYNADMNIRGRIKNGRVELDGSPSIPEGTKVVVYVNDQPTKVDDESTPLPFPIVSAERPGSVNLTSDLIAEMLEDDDVSL